MKLYMSMLYHQLGKKHRVEYNHKKFADKVSLECPMYLSEEPLLPEYVYITGAEELGRSGARLTGLNILCLGKPHFSAWNKGYEMIVVEEDDLDYDIHRMHNEVTKIFQTYREWEERLTALCYGSQDLREIFRCSEEILENPCVLIDSDFSYLGYTGNFFDSSVVSDPVNRSSTPLYYVNEFRLDEEFKKLTRKKGVFAFSEYPELGNMLCCNITYRNRYFARLIVHDEYRPLCRADEWHVSILAQHIQTIFDNRTNLLTFPHSGENLHRLLQTMVVERQIVSGFDIERILAGSEWNRGDRYRVIFLKLLVSPGVDINAAYLCSKIERLWKGSCTLQAEEGILWVLNLSQYADSNDYSFYDTLAYFLRESLCQAGISNIYSDLGQTALYYQQAQIALRIGGQQNPTQWYHYFADYALDYMLSQCTQQFPAEELCHPAVLTLLRHDEQKHTSYYQTLKTYLDHRFSIVDTAETLFIHRTTLISRLKKIQKLYPVDLEDPQTVHHLMLSFALLGAEC